MYFITKEWWELQLLILQLLIHNHIFFCPTNLIKHNEHLFFKLFEIIKKYVKIPITVGYLSSDYFNREYDRVWN